MQEILSFFKLDLYQLTEVIRPIINSYGWILVPVLAFSRSIPILGLFTNRIPLFLALCIFATSILQIALIVAAFLILSFLADFLTYTKMSKFWLKFINKIPKDSKTEKILHYYKKKPILITIIGTYSAYTSCLLTPFAKKYELNIKNFWLPRYITSLIILSSYGLLYYYLGSNIKILNNLFSTFGLIIVIAIILGFLLNIIYGMKFLLDIKFFQTLLTYFQKTDK